MYLPWREGRLDDRDIVYELRSFFRRLAEVRRNLGRYPYLNRIQRYRCLNNLLYLEDIEREFHAIDYREDYTLLHESLRRYIYLGSVDLALVLGSERVESRSLFII